LTYRRSELAPISRFGLMQISESLMSPAAAPQVPGPDFDLRAWAERSLLAALILVFLLTGLIPAWTHLGPDFSNYYLVARLYREGYPVERAYEWSWFQRQKDHAGIDRALVSFIPSTLVSAMAIMPLSAAPPLQASRYWLMLNLAFLSFTAAILKLTTQFSLRRIGVLIFLAIAPLRSNFILGQEHVILLFLLALATWLYMGNRPFLSGVVLAAAAAMKIYPAAFLVFFIFKKEWRAAFGLLLGSACAVLLSAFLFGANACWIYLRDVLPWALRGEITDPYDFRWDSISALLHRLFIAEPELNPSPFAHWPSLYALLHPLIHGFIFVAFMWALTSKTRNRERRKLEWACFLFLLLLLSPLPLSFHFLALIVSIALVVDYLAGRKQIIIAGVVVALYALISMPYDRWYGMNLSGWKSLLSFPRLSGMILLGAVLLWILISGSSESFNARRRFQSFLWGALALAILVAAGFVSNLRHLRGSFDNYSTRIATVSGSAIATDPSLSSDSLFFTALVPSFSALSNDSYAVHKLKGYSITSYGGGGDWFHPAVTNDGASWAEVANSKGSHVVRFESGRAPTAANQPSVEADNAEQPVVSPDGNLLAYIRETHGRGSLWVRRVGKAEPGDELIPERQLAGEQYDVRDAAFFPDHRMVFSSLRDGRFELYIVDLQSGDVADFVAVTCSARYPAVSVNGQWMAFSCEHIGYWQLHVMNLHTEQQFQLTASDCNSVSAAWAPNSKDLIYATDCGRGLGITALSKLAVFH
jgi:Glycosyltransferase family 87/WD40-like Beta Propeller Repeat